MDYLLQILQKKGLSFGNKYFKVLLHMRIKDKAIFSVKFINISIQMNSNSGVGQCYQ